jgi:regulatory subunit for Cdc7p protein kinase
MATLSLQPSPHAMANMNPRRAPLREAPSSVLNSPLRAASTAVVGTKRVRSHGVDQREHVYQYGPPPHVKRQAVQADSGDPRGLLRKTGGNPPTALQRKLEAVRDARTAKSNASKTLSEENLENVRQWQRHYRKVFPSITFFFDSVPEPSRLRVASDVRSLGAVSSSSG